MKKIYLILSIILCLIVLSGCNNRSSGSSSSVNDVIPLELIEKYGDPKELGEFAPGTIGLKFSLHLETYYSIYQEEYPEEFLQYVSQDPSHQLWLWGEKIYFILGNYSDQNDEGLSVMYAYLKDNTYSTLYKARDALERYASIHSYYITNVKFDYLWSESIIRVTLTEEETQLNRDLSFYKALDDNIDKIIYDFFQIESEHPFGRSLLIKIKKQSDEDAKSTVLRLREYTQYFKSTHVYDDSTANLFKDRFLSPEEFYNNQKTDS